MKHPALLLLYAPIIILPISGIFTGALYCLNFLAVIIVNLIIMMDMKDKREYVFSPSFVTIMYLYVCFFLGEMLFYNDLYHFYLLQADYYKSWKYLASNTFFYNISSFLILLSYLNSRKKRYYHQTVSSQYTWRHGILAIVLLLGIILSRNELLFTMLCFFSVLLITLSSKLQAKYRRLSFLFVVGIIVALNPDNKRESIFLLYPILFIEIINSKEIKLRTILLISVISILMFVAIVSMSIMRAQMADNLFDSIYLVKEYITSDFALASLADNFEINWCYIDAFQSMEFINSDISYLGWGVSYLKPLFWPIPREIWPEKPESTMLLFASAFDKSGKEADGLSLPIPIVSDLYWHFKYFGILFVYTVHYWLNKIYVSIVDEFRSKKWQKYATSRDFLGLYFMYVFLLLMRGCGFDFFLSYMLSFYILNKLFTIRLSKKHRIYSSQ